jgi:hypothetical protein
VAEEHFVHQAGHGRVGVVGDADGESALPAARLQHQVYVRPLTRLRDADGQGLPQILPGAVESVDGRRGQRGQIRRGDFDQIAPKESGVVGGAPGYQKNQAEVIPPGQLADARHRASLFPQRAFQGRGLLVNLLDHQAH